MLCLHSRCTVSFITGNILISPNRIVLIDFGQAILRGDIVEDDDWAEKVEMQDEVEALRRILHRREIRDRTPYIPENFFPWFLPFQ